MTRSSHIFLRLLLVMIPTLISMAPAKAQNTVFKGETSDLGVIEILGDTYVWELYKTNNVTLINFATDPGNCLVGDAIFTGGNIGPVVNVLWIAPGIYYFKVTAYKGSCTMNLKVGMMTVLDALPTAVIEPPDPICEGSPTNLTVNLTGTAPWIITYTDGTTPVTISGIMASPYLIPVSPAGTTNYKVTSVTDAFGTNNVPSNTVALIVMPRPVVSPIWHN